MTSIFVIKSNKLVKMENKKYKDPILLLPAYCKKLGAIVMIAAFLSAVIIKAMNIEMTPAHKDLYKVILSNLFIAGLFLIVMAREKLEDERTYTLRLAAMSRAFLSIVVYVFLSPFIDLSIQQPIEKLNVQFVIFLMLLIYLISYYSRKTALR